MYEERDLNHIFVTSDTHFGHANVIRYADRPFSNVHEMDETLIKRWNEVVGPDDLIYHLGDFALGENAQQYFLRLNGHIVIVPGSHDYRWLKIYDIDTWHSASNHRVVVAPPLHEISVRISYIKRPLTIVMCHYAMRVWNKSHYDSLHLFGHSHNRLPRLGMSMDVGVDAHNFYPISLRQVLSELQRVSKPNL